MMECRRITDAKGPWPTGAPNAIQYGKERSAGATAFHKVDFAGPLVSVTYGAITGTSGVREAYRLFFADGSVFEITDA